MSVSPKLPGTFGARPGVDYGLRAVLRLTEPYAPHLCLRLFANAGSFHSYTPHSHEPSPFCGPKGHHMHVILFGFGG